MTIPSRNSLTQTNWDLIRDASSGSPTAAESLEAVARRAWPAIYAFIRATGRSDHDAADLTQGFVCEVFLSRNLVERADPQRGRFRTLLVGAVRNYLADMHRRSTAVMRMPPEQIARLDHLREHGIEPVDGATGSPERAFHLRYVASIIETAAERLQAELLADGQETSWEIFRARFLTGAPSAIGSHASTAARFGLSRGECATRLLVAKRRFAALVLDEVRKSVSNPDEVVAEVRDLLDLLQGD